MNWSMLLLLSISFTFTSCDEDPVVEENPVVSVLTQDEIDGLNYMREEEKLARDVYIHFYDIYNLEMFNNISKSEQKHMDQLNVLMVKYDITDPSLEELGKFSNEHLQSLYDALIESGNKSIEDALKVGATIEDVDIYDLDEFFVKVVQEDIMEVYESLNCGSRNHMRSFNKQILKHNTTYEAQFISQERYDEIVGSSNEQCGK